jgi:heptosyltransferase III
MNYKRVIISRTDGIGDVILTLPMLGYLKKLWPEIQILFLGKTYTKSIIESCTAVDEFVNWDLIKDKSTREQISFFTQLDAAAIIHVFPTKQTTRIAKLAKIPIRVGTIGRLYNLANCNRLVRFTRKRSELHEAQLNFKLLKGLGISFIPTLPELPEYYNLKTQNLPNALTSLIDKTKFNLVIHPKSKGSAVEWPESKYLELIETLDENKFNILITGTKDEAELLTRLPSLKKQNAKPLFGLLKLEELIALIRNADGVLAASTGPLHIGAALGKKAIGLYAPQKPIHPGRWAPVGSDAHFLVKNGKKNPIESIHDIEVEEVLDKLN